MFSFLICLLISFFLWCINELNRTYSRVLAIPVRFTHYPAGLKIKNRLPSFIMVEVKASGAKMLKLYLQKSLDEIVVDLSAMELPHQKGQRKVISTLSTIGSLSKLLNTDVELLHLKPDSLYFDFGERWGKKVFVKPDVQLKYENAEGVNVSVLVQPQEVWLEGDSIAILNIDTILTSRIVLNELNKMVETDAEVILPEALKETAIVSPQRVHLSINLDEYVEKWIDVKVEMLNVPAGWEMKAFPEIVRVLVRIPYRLYDSLQTDQILAHADYKQIKDVGKIKLTAIAKRSDYSVLRWEPVSLEYILKKGK